MIFFYDKYDNTLDSYDDETYTTQTKRYAFHSVYDDYSIGTNTFLTHRLSKMSELTLGINYKRDVHKELDDYEEPWEEYTHLARRARGYIWRRKMVSPI